MIYGVRYPRSWPPCGHFNTCPQFGLLAVGANPRVNFGICQGCEEHLDQMSESSCCGELGWEAPTAYMYIDYLMGYCLNPELRPDDVVPSICGHVQETVDELMAAAPTSLVAESRERYLWVLMHAFLAKSTTYCMRSNEMLQSLRWVDRTGPEAERKSDAFTVMMSGELLESRGADPKRQVDHDIAAACILGAHSYISEGDEEVKNRFADAWNRELKSVYWGPIREIKGAEAVKSLLDPAMFPEPAPTRLWPWW